LIERPETVRSRARVFGVHHYTLVQQPDRLPDALLGWLRHLIRR
jgi:hypothetical protein